MTRPSDEMPVHSCRLVHRTADAEKLIAFCARVSNPPNQNSDNIAGLLRFCARQEHWSIFEMASMCVEVFTTRAISPQILRHGKGFSFQEFSQRYASIALLPDLLGEGDMPELRRQDPKNRQNSIDDLDDQKTSHFTWEMQRHFNDAHQLYLRMLEAGIAKECARNVLPLHTPTRLYMHGTLRSWATFLRTRLGNGTQLEHQLIARSAADIFEQEFPTIYEALLSDHRLLDEQREES